MICGIGFGTDLLSKVGGWVLAECFGEVGDVFFDGAEELVIPFAYHFTMVNFNFRSTGYQLAYPTVVPGTTMGLE